MICTSYFYKGTIRYELVGIYPAQDFFAVNPSTGSVTVTRDLATDSFETMQYTVSRMSLLSLVSYSEIVWREKSRYLLSLQKYKPVLWLTLAPP